MTTITIERPVTMPITETEETPEEGETLTVQPKKLSAMMREGAKRRPQAFGMTIGHYPDGQSTSCALAATYEGIFGVLPPDDGLSIFKTIDAILPTRSSLLQVFVDDPTDPRYQGTLAHTIMYLNDIQHWTREAIADWLESIGH